MAAIVKRMSAGTDDGGEKSTGMSNVSSETGWVGAKKVYFEGKRGLQSKMGSRMDEYCEKLTDKSKWALVPMKMVKNQSINWKWALEPMTTVKMVKIRLLSWKWALEQMKIVKTEQ